MWSLLVIDLKLAGFAVFRERDFLTPGHWKISRVCHVASSPPPSKALEYLHPPPGRWVNAEPVEGFVPCEPAISDTALNPGTTECGFNSLQMTVF